MTAQKSPAPARATLQGGRGAADGVPVRTQSVRSKEQP